MRAIYRTSYNTSSCISGTICTETIITLQECDSFQCYVYISTVVGFSDSSPSCEVDDDETQQIQINWRSSYSQRHVLDQNTQYQARKLCSHGCYRCVCVFETWYVVMGLPPSSSG